jgi:adenylate cyclase class 2
MQTEYEATFIKVDKEEMRTKFKLAGAKLIRPEFLQTRKVFDLPSGHEIADGWLRVRDEGDKITMSLKIVGGKKIEDQKELCLKIDNFEAAVELLKSIGCSQKAYQESRRELWMIDDVEITIDEWPFLEPFVEIEAKTEEEVKRISALLGFDYNQAIFCSVDTLYSQKYNIDKEVINHGTTKIVFDMDNPFEKK